MVATRYRFPPCTTACTTVVRNRIPTIGPRDSHSLSRTILVSPARARTRRGRYDTPPSKVSRPNSPSRGHVAEVDSDLEFGKIPPEGTQEGGWLFADEPPRRLARPAARLQLASGAARYQPLFDVHMTITAPAIHLLGGETVTVQLTDLECKAPMSVHRSPQRRLRRPWRAHGRHRSNPPVSNTTPTGRVIRARAANAP